MTRKAGIPLVDLFGLTDQINSVLPDDIQDFVDRFSAIDHRTTRSTGAIIHHGKLQLIEDALLGEVTEFPVGFGTLALPLVHGGLPFQLSMTRQPPSGNIERAADAWQLNIFLSDFILTVNGLEPAIFVPESGTAPRHLVRDKANSKVRIIGSATLRLQKFSGSPNIVLGFVDQPDPLDPGLGSGGVASLTFSPPSFFLGSSEHGMTVGQMLYDFSESFSPPFVLEHNQGPAWQGLVIREATYYAPRNLPLVGDVSGGVRDVLIGIPMGIQGELELQFGRSPLDPATFQFLQGAERTPRGSTGSGTSRTVTIEANQNEDVTIHAGFSAPAPPAGSIPDGAAQEWLARWTWDGGTTTEGDSSTATVRHASRLVVEPIEIVTVDGVPTRFNHPPVTFRFVTAAEVPRIGISIGTQSFDNVVHIGGSAADIGALTLNASSTMPGTSTFTWTLAAKNIEHTGPDFTPDVSGLRGRQTIVLTEEPEGDEETRVTRIIVLVLDEGDLLIGTEDGVFDASDSSTSLTVSAVEATYDLSDFYASGNLNSKAEQAVVDASEAAKVKVPPDSLAQVVVSDTPTTPDIYDRHVQILMEFEHDNPTKWGNIKPANGPSSFANVADLQIQLLEWASHYPDADFLVIGRCDDVGVDVPGESPDSFNIGLAINRAAKGRELLTILQPGATGTVIDNAKVFSRGETSVWDDGSAAGEALQDDPSLSDDHLIIKPEQSTDAVGNASLAEGWLIKFDYKDDHTDWENFIDSSHTYNSTREQYRRVDIYAVGGTAPTDGAIINTGEAERDPVLRRSMVPSDDNTPAPIPASASAMDYRVRLLITWDSPTVTEMKDAIPTLAEAEFAWTPTDMPLPQVNGEDVSPSREVLTVYAKWAHDARTGFTRLTLGIRSDGDPEGLFSLDSKILTAAMAFGPALITGVDSDNDLIGQGAKMAALISAAVVGGAFLIEEGSNIAWIQLEGEAQTRSISDPGEDYQIKLTMEYTCTIHVDAGVLGIATADDRPMKIRYKNVGLEFDNSKDGWDKVGLAFDTSSMEIEDSGQWMISGVLGSLLRIVEITFGTGSVWVEGRIAVAINIGVIEISEAIIRLTFHDGNPIPEFELRGFVLTADIPNVLEGEGRLRIEDSGIVRAGIDATVVPLGAAANAALAFGTPPEIAPDVFLSLHLGVQFSTPIPLAQSGAALYGFKGMFTMNGTRDIPDNPDPIARELDWWAIPPELKYKPESDQYAIGVGVVVGTMPDVSFCFSASGMVVVAFPDPEVILGIDVKIIEVPDTEVSDEGSPTGTITGMIVIDSEAVKVSVSAEYDIPKLVHLKVPFGAYFPYTGNGIYVRLGSDGVTATQSDGTTVTRHGEPITLTLLPGTLDATAWAYLMIEQGGLPSLGGDPDFSFDGFSVGFGAGWGIEWSAGPISLSASGKVLVGFGTKPLLIKGGVFVEGELDLVVLSISARGSLVLTYLDENVYLDGEFCGEVDLFFFSLEGCVGVSIGTDTGDDAPPEPEPPLAGISLVDRKDQIMGVAVPTSQAIAKKALFAIDEDGNNTGVSPHENNTVWPDTAPVLHFSHYVDVDSVVADQFDMPNSDVSPALPKWFGGNRLKYAYRLNSIILRRKPDDALVEGDEKLQTVWMTSPYRLPDGSGVDNPLPSEHEGPNLKLLDWNPWNWVVNTDDGGEGTGGDPVKEIEDLCDSLPMPRHACVFGRAAAGAGWYAVKLRQETLASPPYPSRFCVTGEPVMRLGGRNLTGRELQYVIQQVGGSLIPGQITDLPFDIPFADETLKQGYILPYGRRAVSGGLETFALPWEAKFDRELASPSVTLLICDALAKPTNDDKDCIEFEGLKVDNEYHTAIVYEGVSIRSLDRTMPFILRDIVDATANPARRGSDGNADIYFPEAGLKISFRQPCRQVELSFMKSSSRKIKVAAFGIDGQQVDTAIVNGPNDVPLVARLHTAHGISELRITGGSGEASLYRICCRSKGTPPPDPDPQPCENFKTLKPSNRKIKRFAHEGYSFSVVRESDRLLRPDLVDQSGIKPLPGSDNSAEIQFPKIGMTVRPENPCKQFVVWVMQFSEERVIVTGFNADGKKIAVAKSGAKPDTAYRLFLQAESGEPIDYMIVQGGQGKAVLFRICCLDDKPTVTECMTFEDAPSYDVPVARFVHSGVTFSDLQGKDSLVLSDNVDAAASPVVQGEDGVLDLSFSNNGMRIELPGQCEEISIYLMLFDGPVKAQALNSLGARTDNGSTGSETKVEQVLTLKGPGITVVDMFGGGDKAFIYKICCKMPEDRDPDVPLETGTDPFPKPAAADPSPVPVVRGIIGSDLADNWIGRVVKTVTDKNRTCRVMEFTPERGQIGPWNGAQVLSPVGQDITLLAICGVDQVMVDQRSDDQAARDDRLDEVSNAQNTLPTERREILLEPGTIYEIELRWSWQFWKSNDDATDSPPATPSGTWTDAAEPIIYHFAVAEEDTETGKTQDGLNEYVFDARDIARHLIRVEPADGRVVHFTDDPVWAHFDAGHMNDLLDQYGRELKLEIKRTDPPPQSDPGMLAGLLAPLESRSISWMNSPATLNPTGYQRINSAVLGVPCLGDTPVVGGASVMATFDLEPNAMYDFNIIVPKSNGSDRLVVSATRFTTSRYAGPEALMNDLGYGVDAQNPYRPDDIILPIGATLPDGAAETSDSLMDDLLREMQADTLPLPDNRPLSYAVWRQDGAGWLLEGLLIDSLETLNRSGAVQTSAGSEITTRCAIDHLTIAGNVFSVLRANANWTRVFLKPAAPVSLNEGKHDMTLVFETSDGALSGRKSISHLPGIIEREGL